MEFRNGVLTQYLAKCQRKNAIMLCWEKAPTRHDEHKDAACPRSARPGEAPLKYEICAQVSSVPRLLGALGTAPRRRVENEKWAATFPSGRGCSVSSSRNSSSSAAALTAITAPIRSEKMREGIIVWSERRRKGNMAMPAFPGRSKLDVREKAVGSCVERGQRRLSIPTQAIDRRDSGSEFDDFLPCTRHFHPFTPSFFPTRHLFIQIRVVLI
jgi:hypothetical protein